MKVLVLIASSLLKAWGVPSSAACSVHCSVRRWELRWARSISSFLRAAHAIMPIERVTVQGD